MILIDLFYLREADIATMLWCETTLILSCGYLQKLRTIFSSLPFLCRSYLK